MHSCLINFLREEIEESGHLFFYQVAARASFGTDGIKIVVDS